MNAQMDKSHSTYITQLEKYLNQIKLCVHTNLFLCVRSTVAEKYLQH